MKRIGITGMSGFAGTNLSNYLSDRAFDVVNLNLRTDSWQKLLEFDCDVVIHLAGKAHDLKNTSEPEDYYKINCELTNVVYKKFLQSNASTFIFVSSVKAVKDTVEGVLTEVDIPTPETHYGKSKLLAEQFILDNPPPIGKRFFIVRPCMIHGPGNKGNLNLLYQFMKLGIPYPLAAFKNKRSFLSIENFCFLMVNLIENNNLSSNLYHLADDVPLSTNEVVEILAKSVGKKSKLLKVKPSFVKLIARIGDAFKLPFNSERLEKMTENYVVQNLKIKGDLNISLPVSSREGLKITAESFNKLK